MVCTQHALITAVLCLSLLLSVSRPASLVCNVMAIEAGILKAKASQREDYR